MDPRKLVYLATIIEQGSLAKAARVLAVSQPALTKSMNRLESEVGMKLLERGSTGIMPTRSGELLYAHARSIRTEVSLAESRVQGSDGNARVITLATLPSLASSVVPLAVSRWRNRHPGVLLRIVEKIQIELLLGLLRNEFDFVIGQTEFFDIHLDRLKQRVLFRDRLCVFARRDHPLFELASPTWEDLVQFPWVCPMVGWPQRTIMEKLIAAEGLDPPRQLVECGSMGFTKALVAASDHLALLPAHCVNMDEGEAAVESLRISVSAFKRDIAVVFRAGAPLSADSQELVSLIAEIGTDLSRMEGSAPPIRRA